MMFDFRLPPRLDAIYPLLRLYAAFVMDVSGQPAGRIFKGQTVLLA